MSEVRPPRRDDVTPSVRALLAIFNEDNSRKLALAPVDSQPIVHLADGTLGEVDENGWIDAFVDRV
ncbi:hypothetical protein ACQP2U_09190 [Nocardia sp. CA-084685]|uniref:hypothetical protein n=1 Tax=Nocardia sp. CA-084685 TaxID=3239970 RepID=UPI003D991D67